jgi:hypothetical protein
MQERHGTRETSLGKIGPGTVWNEEPRKDKKRLWKGLECKIGIKDPGRRWQLCCKIERTADGFNKLAFRLEFMKRAAGMSSRLQKLRDWTFCRGQPPPEREIRDWTLWKCLAPSEMEEEPDMSEHWPL